MTLRERLEAQAPLRLDHYIEACLWDTQEGYYRKKEVFGAEGDFVTSPEISQVFGEVIAIWAFQTWQEMGSPDCFALLEMGAGRGDLMRDFLRVARQIPAFFEALDVHILEKSQARRAEQRAKIKAPISFLDRLELPELPALVISNEFFDALPIRQFRQEGGGWLEAFVDAKLQRQWQPCPLPPKALAPYFHFEGIIEINELAVEITCALGAHIGQYGGAMLTIDYGEYEGTGDTLQAMENHQRVDPFANPGQADLTAHVRFRDLAEAAKLSGDFMTQGEFLSAWGGDARIDKLCALNPQLAENLQASYDRLTNANQMGKLFKVLIQKAE